MDDESVVSIIALKRELVDEIKQLWAEFNPLQKKLKNEEKLTPDELAKYEEIEPVLKNNSLAFATKKGVLKKSYLHLFTTINRRGKIAINLADDDELITVRHGTDSDDVVLLSSNGRACRFNLDSVRPQGRTAGGVRGIKLEEGCDLVGMMMASKEKVKSTWVLTITKQGMCKRTIIDTGDMKQVLDANGEKIWDDVRGDWKTRREGYRITNRGMKGPRGMGLNEGDTIVRVHQIPDENDQLMLLSAKGTVIRIAVNQTKENKGLTTKGTRVMDLRDKKDKSKFVDELIFSARLPADLVDENDDVDEIEQVGVDGEEE
tara:strand:- start:179 stop:1132 length:954 start_codon:yes stop_codon:yes gene_type:complete